MPFTPFHLGPALFFGLLLFRRIHFPTSVVASVIIDLEPFLVLVLGLDYPLHGFFHSFLGGGLAAALLALAMVRLEGVVQRFVKPLGLDQNLRSSGFWIASFTGVYLHILLDSPLYTDIRPFYPFDVNPFIGVPLGSGLIIGSSEVYTFCILSFLAGAVLYGWRLFKIQGSRE